MIKKVLLNILGEKRYLSTLAGTFQRLSRTGLLGKEYQDVYFLKKIIRQGDYCVDIGAHLGYYTLELSRLAGAAGRVLAVEPMTPFHDTLKRLIEKKKAGNITLYKLALGGEGEYVEMGIPQLGAMKRFAFARIKDKSQHLEFVESEKVKNESGDHLFSQLPRLDYIKCDVEGFEYEVFASMTKTLEKYHPLLLCELFDRDLLVRFFELVKPFGYQAYSLEQGKLKPFEVYAKGQIASLNYYFLPQQHIERLHNLIAATH